MRARREQARNKGYQFLLKDATRDQEGEPFFISMRRLSLQEKASVNGISEEMQNVVWDRTRALADSHQVKKMTNNPDEIFELVKSNTALQDAVDAVIWAVVIDPKVTMDEAEADENDDLWHVSDFTAEDKWSIYQAAMDSDSKEARSLKMFRSERTTDVGDLGTLQTPAATESTTVLESSES